MMQKIRKNATWLLPAVAVILVAGLMLSRVLSPGEAPQEIPEPEVRITAEEATDHIGQAAEVCGTVADASFHQNINGHPTFINFGREHPNQIFTIVIWGEDRHRWSSEPHRIYGPGVELCVTGEIDKHDGTPQIQAFHPDQIRRR